ncbi:MAG: FAD-dependent oxidoreductase [Pirellulales bacterium]
MRGFVAAWTSFVLFALSSSILRAESRTFDVIVYSATPAGVCSAVAARREGATVALIESSDLVGGVMSGGLSFSDSNQTARECLGGLFEEIHQRIEKKYVDRGVTLPYKVAVKDQAVWTYEPHVAEAVFHDLLSESGVVLYARRDLRNVDKSSARLQRITTTTGDVLTARVFVDASYEGDLLAKAGVKYRIGREGRAEYDESLAGKRFPKKVVPVSPFDAQGRLLPLLTGKDAGPEDAGDEKVMIYSFRMCFSKDPVNRVPIEKPTNYDPARFELYRRAFAEDPKMPFPIDLYPIPGNKLDGNNGIGKQFSIGLNGASWEWPDASPERRREIWNEHKTYTHEFLWFLAHDEGVPPAIRKQATELGLAKNEFAKYGHWPPALYVREGRRMSGEFVLTQSDILKNIEKPDPIAVGSFPIDSHDCQRIPSKDGGGFVNEGTIFPVRLKERKIGQPHHLPYRCLLPKSAECDNLLVPVALSATHVAYSSVRVEPTWITLGQSAGVAAALIVKDDVPAQRLEYEHLKKRLLAVKQILELPPQPK